MEYPELTYEQECAVKALFNTNRVEWAQPHIELRTEHDGYYIDLSDDDDYVKFADGLSVLTAYHKIAEILHCTDGDEINRKRVSLGGSAETGEWGADYNYTLHFW